MSIEDRVAIRLGGKEIRICEGYEVHMGVLTQPSRFAVRVGHSGTIAELLKKYPPGTTFELLVYDGKEYKKQFTGVTDGRRANGKAATATFRGRDNIAQLFGDAVADKTYEGKDYLGLIDSVLKDAGVSAKIIDESASDRTTKTGAHGATGSTKVKSEVKKKGKKLIVHPPTIKAGEDRYRFLKQHLDRVGLFLFGGANGELVLGAPDRDQPALYQVVNRRDGDANVPGTVTDWDFDEDTTNRCSKCVVYGRGGGKGAGRTKAHKSITDDEMSGFGFFYRTLVKIDQRVSSIDEGEFYARQAISESRRGGWALEYVVAGHTTQPKSGGSKRIVWARDTVVHVIDEELGLNEEMYVESVTLRGDESKTETSLRLMRKEDLRFLDDPAENEP